MQTIQKNELQKFEFNSSQFRIINKNDNLFFLATDVARLLGYKRPQDLIEKVHITQKLKEEIALSGQNREVWLFTEGGFYAALLKSGKELALPFQLYVTDKVLPTIRKTGVYESTSVLKEKYHVNPFHKINQESPRSPKGTETQQLSLFSSTGLEQKKLQQLVLDVALRAKMGTPEYKLVKALKVALFEEKGGASC